MIEIPRCWTICAQQITASSIPVADNLVLRRWMLSIIYGGISTESDSRKEVSCSPFLRCAGAIFDAYQQQEDDPQEEKVCFLCTCVTRNLCYIYSEPQSVRMECTHMTVSQPALSSRSKIIRHRCSFEDVQRNKVIRNVFVCESRGGSSKHKKHFNGSVRAMSHKIILLF
jgi:hypothetical protein